MKSHTKQSCYIKQQFLHQNLIQFKMKQKQFIYEVENTLQMTF